MTRGPRSETGPGSDLGPGREPDGEASIARERPWTRRDGLILAIGLLAGVAIRIALLPAVGLKGDIDQFVLWVHGLATGPFGRAYDQDLTFLPVMAYVWGALAAIEPAFRTATESSDVWIRSLMKVPASLADIGLVLALVWALRARPAWAVGTGVAVALHPAVVDVSAWWGQYESIYLLPAVGAAIAAGAGRRDLAAVLLAVSLMTKPQALPFLVPFAAWFLATGGWRGALRAAALGAATVVVLWLPFLADGGPAGYLRNLDDYQNARFAFLSLRAWNPWWLLQEVAAGGGFAADTNALIGPITLRHVGFAMAGLLELVVFLAVLRRPTRRVLALGLAAATLAAFIALTTMHERYAFGVLVFLPLAFPDRRAAWLWLAFGVVFTLNLLWAVPPADVFRMVLSDQRLVGLVGPVAMTVVAGALVAELLAASRSRAAPA